MASINLKVKANILEQLECPICKEYLSAPIQQCLTGHSVCGLCKEKLNNCPLCKARFTDARNFALETVMSDLKIVCRKCKLLIPLNAQNHKYKCIKEEIKCEFAICGWTGTRNLINDHIKEQHHGYLLQSGHKYRFHQCGMFVLQYKEQYFWIRCSSVGKHWHWSAQAVCAWNLKQYFQFSVSIKGNGVLYEFTQPCKSNDVSADIVANDNLIGVHGSLITNPNLDICLNIIESI